MHALELARLSDDARRNYVENASKHLGRHTAGAGVKNLSAAYYTARQVLHGLEIHAAEMVNGGGAPDAQLPVMVRAVSLATAWGFVQLCSLRRYRVPGGHVSLSELMTRLCRALPHEFRLIAASDDDLRCSRVPSGDGLRCDI
jgi:hypothetical protein